MKLNTEYSVCFYFYRLSIYCIKTIKYLYINTVTYVLIPYFLIENNINIFMAMIIINQYNNIFELVLLINHLYLI